MYRHSSFAPIQKIPKVAQRTPENGQLCFLQYRSKNIHTISLQIKAKSIGDAIQGPTKNARYSKVQKYF